MQNIPEWSASKGAIIMPGRVTLPKIWQRLHDNATQWAILFDAKASPKNLAALDSVDLDLLGRLSECPADAWRAICSGAGNTLMGAVGLSWCRDVELMDVWNVWASSGLPLLSPPVCRRPARLLNPRLVGDTLSLNAMTTDSSDDSFLACVRAARAGSDILVDIEQTRVPHVPAVLAHFVLDAIRDRVVAGPQDRAFVDHWSRRQEERVLSYPKVLGQISGTRVRIHNQ